jgi:O-acetyl-ADP-ribose deacetylase (regulator of RNase III)
MELHKRITVITGDITKCKVDAIVNAANSSLLGGGGVDGAIHRAAGPALSAECRKIRDERLPGGLPTGRAVLTGAGRLGCTYVIHTVGPVWNSAAEAELDRLLADCYRNSLALAAEHGVQSLAFPAISTGVYGYPKDRAARIAYDTVNEYLQAHELPRSVCFVFFTPGDMKLFLESIKTQ